LFQIVIEVVLTPRNGDTSGIIGPTALRVVDLAGDIAKSGKRNDISVLTCA
jgi:hypothetical protein